MISYKDIGINLFKYFILTYLLFFISIQTPFGGITIDRVLTLFTFVLIITKFKHRYTLFSKTIFIFICFVTLNKLVYFTEITPKYFVFLISMITLFNCCEIGKLNFNFHKFFLYSYLILLLISIYSVYAFLNTGLVPSSFAILDSIPFIRTVNYEHMDLVNQSYIFPRLSLPYPTPPQLSLVLAIYLLYFLKDHSFNIFLVKE